MSEKWWDMSDDELDDLFREASDKVEVPFESSAYNKLRQKITEQPKSESSKGFKKRWLLLFVGLFLMVGVGLVYRFGNKDEGLKVDTNENKLTKIGGKIERNNKLKPSNVSSSVQLEIIKNKDSKLLKSEIMTNKGAISTIQKENIVEKSTSPLSVNKVRKSLLSVSPETTQKPNSNRLSVKTQIITESETKAIEHTKIEGELLSTLEKTTENKQVNKSMSSTLLSVSSQTTHKTMKPLSVETQTTTEEENLAKPSANTETQSQTTSEELNKAIESVYYNSKNNKKQLYRFNNSKNNKDREGKNYPINPPIIGQNTSPIVEHLSVIPQEILSEETVDKTNFYDVNFLKNKDLKLILTDIHAELPYYIDSLPRTTKPLKFSKFGLRLVLSPDMNSIENLGKVALGGSIGLLFEYKISKKLSLQTGMIYSKKSYIGSFDDYHNWTDWKGYHPSKPTEVDGGCKVIDIPINLRLNLFQKPKQTWFISSGVSSYWMLNESYTYLYGWSLPKTVDWSDNSKYYFSVLNFSVGLERQISTRFSLQVEPYLKTPLKNVGRGGVNLYSSGLLFSTKYSF